MIMSTVKEAVKLSPWSWLLSGKATGVNCVNGNETREAADARVPLQSESHQQIPLTETVRDILAPWRWS